MLALQITRESRSYRLVEHPYVRVIPGHGFHLPLQVWHSLIVLVVDAREAKSISELFLVRQMYRRG